MRQSYVVENYLYMRVKVHLREDHDLSLNDNKLGVYYVCIVANFEWDTRLRAKPETTLIFSFLFFFSNSFYFFRASRLTRLTTHDLRFTTQRVF